MQTLKPHHHHGGSFRSQGKEHNFVFPSAQRLQGNLQIPEKFQNRL